MINDKNKVEAFLRQFMPKFDVWGIFFLDREKNRETLLQLNMSPREREDIIREITSDDYIETITDTMNWGEMWVFGKDVKSRELYIKIALGDTKSKTICISFHIAEYPIAYAFK